jgi:DNA invertase Pin-like site-specific DNA recombinase
MTNPTPRRAALYVRISRSKEESVSLERQERDLRIACDLEGWEVAEVIVDDGKSGTKERAGASRALELLRSGAIDVLCVWALDRWSRQGLRAVADLIDVLKVRKDAMFYAKKDGLRSDAQAWRIVASVLAEVAAMEAENTSARIQAARAEHLSRTAPEEQRFLGGQAPFGYRIVANPHGPGRALAVDEYEAHIVRTVAGRLIDGEILASVTRWLESECVPTPQSAARRARQRGVPTDGLDRGRWRVTTVRNLWRSETLIGRTTRREPVLGPDGKPILDAKGLPKLEQRLVTDRAGLPLTRWAPVIDLDTFAQLQARLPGHGRTQPRRMASWLSDVAFCDGCGGKLYVQRAKRSHGEERYFRCAGRGDALDTCPAPATVSVSRLEAHIEEVFLSFGGHLPEVILEQRVSAPDTALELRDIDHSIEDILRAIRADGADYAALTARIEGLKARRREVVARPSEFSVVTRETGRTLADVWADLGADLASRREHVRQVIERAYIGRAPNSRIPITNERVRIVWNPDREVDLEEGNSSGPNPDRAARRKPRG